MDDKTIQDIVSIVNLILTLILTKWVHKDRKRK